MQYIQIAIYLLTAVFLIILVRYLWIMFFIDKDYYPEQWKFLVKSGQVSKEIRELEKYFPDKVRFFNFWFQAERIKKDGIKGSFAELGVYKGDTAKILHNLDVNRKLFLFDSFTGFEPEDLKVETGEAATYKQKDFADTSLEKVTKYINGNDNIIFRKGYFPETTNGLENEIFSLVNIDADLYKPTKDGLEFFYPRLSAGGVIIVHDYNNKWEGLMKAVDEFVKTIPESLIEIPDLYGSAMIVKAKF
ncbi:MAG: TylF/MycF family methyltransferase [Saprospiraceae bacterium]|nr:TylF/MycF family methyltransferase [Saprospiraceae bacterium]